MITGFFAALIRAADRLLPEFELRERFRLVGLAAFQLGALHTLVCDQLLACIDKRLELLALLPAQGFEMVAKAVR